jgi:undecaprenyl-diphosphatase
MINNMIFWQPGWQFESLLMLFFSHWFLWVLVFFLSFFWLVKKRLKQLWSFWGLIIFSEFFHSFLKIFSPWQRPFYSDETVPPQWIGSYSEGSFPSGHALRSIIILYFIWKENKKLFWLFLPAVFLVSVGRVFFGLHYPVDILGGYLVGILVVYIFSRLTKAV